SLRLSVFSPTLGRACMSFSECDDVCIRAARYALRMGRRYSCHITQKSATTTSAAGPTIRAKSRHVNLAHVRPLNHHADQTFVSVKDVCELTLGLQVNFCHAIHVHRNTEDNVDDLVFLIPTHDR